VISFPTNDFNNYKYFSLFRGKNWQKSNNYNSYAKPIILWLITRQLTIRLRELEFRVTYRYPPNERIQYRVSMN